MKKSIVNIVTFLSLGFIFAIFFSACEDENRVKYNMTGGVPELHYIRLTDPLKADSLLVAAYMEQTICLMGKNLTSIQEIYFNDQKAVLNINFITNNTLIVSVPKDIPVDVTNKIYMITGSGEKVDYDFKVIVPTPQLSRMKNEFAQVGEVNAIYGDYLLDDPNVPLKVVFSGNVEAEIVSSDRRTVQFKVPEGALEGPVIVSTQYGTTRSVFRYRDSRGWITGFEASENGGLGFAPGWGRPGRIEEDPALSLVGKYAVLDGAIGTSSSEDSWASMGSPINIWSCDNLSNPNIDIPNPMFSSNPETSILKLEVNVRSAWSGSPMIFCFSDANDLEGYLWGDLTQPRGFWAPWKDVSNGSYVSDGWETVSIPLAEMKYNGSEEEIKVSTKFGQLGISVHNRGGISYIGTACHPVILVDNVRVVPGE